MDLKLKDKAVVITAGTGGCGKELVKAFAAEGCRLAVTSTSQEKLDAFIPTLGIAPDHIRTYVVDMTVEEQVKDFINDAAAHYGRIATFCNLYPDRRYCLPEEVAYMALYLASELSAHVNGSGIRLDGGMDARD